MRHVIRYQLDREGSPFTINGDINIVVNPRRKDQDLE